MAAAEQEWRSGEAKLDRESQEKMNTEDLQEARAIRDAEFKSDMIVASIAAIAKIMSNSVLGDGGGESLLERGLNLIFGDDKGDGGDGGDEGGWPVVGAVITAAILKEKLDPGNKTGFGEEFWQAMADEMNIARNGETETTTTNGSGDQSENGPAEVVTETTDETTNETGSDRATEFDKKEREVEERASGGGDTGDPDPDGVTNQPIEIEWDRIDFKQMFKGTFDAIVQTGMSRQVGYEYWAAQNPGWDQAVGGIELGLTVYNGFQAGGPAGAVSAYVGWVAGNVIMAQFGERRADTHAQMDMTYDEAMRQMSPEMFGEAGKLASRVRLGRWSMEIDMANGEVQWRPDETGSVGQSYKQFREPIAEWSARNKMLVLPTQKDVLQLYAKDGNAYQRNFYEKWYQELDKRKIFEGVGSGEDGKVKWAFVSPDGVVSYYNFVGERLGGFNINAPINGSEGADDQSGEGLGEEDEDTMHSDQGTERTS